MRETLNIQLQEIDYSEYEPKSRNCIVSQIAKSSVCSVPGRAMKQLPTRGMQHPFGYARMGAEKN